MLVENFEIWQLWIIVAMLISCIAIGYAIRVIILSSSSRMVLKNLFTLLLIALFFILIALVIKIWPGISYPNLAAGMVGLMIGLIRIKR